MSHSIIKNEALNLNGMDYKVKEDFPPSIHENMEDKKKREELESSFYRLQQDEEVQFWNNMSN